MIVAIEALDAWWPPTFSPDGLGRTRLAWCTIDVASHSTRCSTAARTAVVRVAGAAVIDGSFRSRDVERTATSLVMRRLVDHRLDPLLRKIADAR